MAVLGCVRWLLLSRSLISRTRPPTAALIPATGRTNSDGPCRQSAAFSTSRLGLCSEKKVTVHFINRDGDKLTAEGKLEDSLLDVVIDHNLDIDGFGACEGTLACSTCHLIFEDHIFKNLDKVTNEEMDMLDLAYGLTETAQEEQGKALQNAVAGDIKKCLIINKVAK
ncbi:adrenodoxin, mitochondrial isoform X2 [Latimeria chalumnae]|uniref:adrenodoxin, mitochondrial isoform X2 n=1 Tax=Latimeria chalumnae TaxID=7897 RepID=UPI00313C6983